MKKNKYLVPKISIILSVLLGILLTMKWVNFYDRSMNGIQYFDEELNIYIIFIVISTIFMLITSFGNKVIRIIFSVIGSVGFIVIAITLLGNFYEFYDYGMQKLLGSGFKYSLFVVVFQVLLGIINIIMIIREKKIVTQF